jgi:membrane protein implicated in regulation of membrane protease activity
MVITWLQNIWNWTIQPIPLLLALAIYFVPIIYVQWKRYVYTPLYFLVPFIRVQLIDVKHYLGGEFFAPFIQDEDEAEKLRKKTMLTASFSALLHVILIPSLVALIWSFVLSSVQFITALMILLTIRAYQFFISVCNFRHYTIDTPRFKGWLAAFYVVVLCIIALTMLIVWNSVGPFIATKNYVPLIWNTAKWFFWNVIVAGIVVTGFTTWINSLLFDKAIRQSNLNKNGAADESKKTVTKPDVSAMPESRNQG